MGHKLLKLYILIFLQAIHSEPQEMRSEIVKYSQLVRRNKSIQRSKPVVIILNGPSYSGKTTVREIIQNKSPLGFIYVGFDLLFVQMARISDSRYDGHNYDRYMQRFTNPDGSIVWNNGPDFLQYFIILGKLLKALLASGKNNIVVDEVFTDLHNLLNYLRNVDTQKCDVYIFNLSRSEETAKKRAAIRGGERIATQNNAIKCCDLAFVTDNLTPEEIAEKILRHIEEYEPHSVYQNLQEIAKLKLKLPK